MILKTSLIGMAKANVPRLELCVVTTGGRGTRSVLPGAESWSVEASSTLSYASAASPILLSGVHANNKSELVRERELLGRGEVVALESSGFCCSKAMYPGRLSRALGEGCWYLNAVSVGAYRWRISCILLILSHLLVCAYTLLLQYSSFTPLLPDEVADRGRTVLYSRSSSSLMS